MTDLLAGLSGSLVGLILGVVGGGGSILAVPLLVYAVGIASPHVAIGTSAVAVAGSALVNLRAHTRAGNVKWPCGLVFAATGVAGALAGSSVAKAVDGQRLLGLFGLLMVVVGIIMFVKRDRGGDADVRLSRTSAGRLLPGLMTAGFCTGLLSGFFGIGGGFLIVPALMLATGMTMIFAVGTSLVAVSAFGAATATSYAMSGLVDWHIALIFIAGGVLGSVGARAVSRFLSSRKNALGSVLAAVVIVVGLYVIARSLLAA